jgi:hypothetical protein
VADLRRGRGSETDDGDVADVPGDDGEADEVRLDAGKTMASSACSKMCWNRDEVRTEKLLAVVIFG